MDRCVFASYDWWASTLWSNGVLTYDNSMKEKFVIKATLIWTIMILTYGILLGWCTQGKICDQGNLVWMILNCFTRIVVEKTPGLIVIVSSCLLSVCLEEVKRDLQKTH